MNKLVRSKRSNSKAFGLAIMMLSLCATSPAYPLELTIHPNTSPSLSAVMAYGEVVDGDVEALESFLQSLPKKITTAVYLASPGGNLYEGMKLGRFFKENRIKTVVEGGADCASACALAFLGGTDGAGKSWRSSSSNSRLGFHAFSSEGDISPDNVQAVVADILMYAVAVDAPIFVIVKAFETPSREMYWLDQQEICNLGVKLWSNEEARFIC